MPIHLHRGLRADTLADALALQLACAPSDPMVPDIVAVPTRGVERFLAQRLSLHLGASAGAADGVCANVRFPSPQELLESALGGAGRSKPWSRPLLTWSVAAQLPRLATQPQFSVVARHLSGPDDGPTRGRLYDTASRVAALLERYDQERPSLVAGWIGPPGLEELAAEHHWQALLFRALVAQIGPSPGMELAAECAQLRADPALSPLPATISFFGPTRIPGRSLEILRAIAADRDVHLWLVDPAPGAWARVPQVALADARRPTWTHSLPEEAALSSRPNPLLASLGRDFAELDARLRPLAATDTVHGPAVLPAVSLLAALQADIAADRGPRPLTEVPSPTDTSLVLHSCYGPQRQVQVIKEVVLDLLEADPSLQARDILVMTPDLELFGPLFTATFERPGFPIGSDPIADLRARVADRTPEQGNQVLIAILAALELLHSRATIGEVLDFAALPAVARRFGFSEDDLTRASELAQSSAVRWGLGKHTRERYQLGWVGNGTWAFGLDRMLLGVACSEAELVSFGGSLPLDDVASTDIDLLGRLHELVATLTAAEVYQSSGHGLAEWIRWLESLLVDLTATIPADAWMTTNALAAISAPMAVAGSDGVEIALEAADIRSMLRAAVAMRPTRSNFRTGGMTLSGMVPMRSVPHRVIILAGMDDAAFPRSADPDGDDILAAQPHVGERDPRSEERQLFLDAVMAAQSHLIITYTGHDERTNEPRPACAPVGELWDVVQVMLGGRTPAGRVLIEHPLQPFDPRNFIPGALVPGAAFSHDKADRSSAEALLGPRKAPPAFMDQPLPKRQINELPLTELSSVLEDPVAGFLRYRLGLPTSGEDEPAEERLPVELKGLANWQVGDRLLSAVLRGVPAAQLAAVEPLRGMLPPGALGQQELKRLGNEVEALAQSVTAWLSQPVTAVRVSLPISGVLLHGSVADCASPQGLPGVDALVVRASYSKVKPSAQVRLWVQLLAVAASRPEHRWGAVLQARDCAVAMVAPEAGQALDQLVDLMALYSSAMCEPLPMPPKSAYEYALARNRRASREEAMKGAQKRGWDKYGDQAAAPVQMVWRSPKSLADVCQKPRDGESHPEEAERFAILARLLWDPILAAQQRARPWVGTR